MREAVGVRAGEFSRLLLIFLFHFRKKICASLNSVSTVLLIVEVGVGVRTDGFS